MKKLLHILLALTLMFVSGCNDNSPSPNDQKEDQLVLADSPNDSCTVSSGVLQPNQSLTLNVLQSSAKYSSGSVTVQTLVSFAVCAIDTGGINIRPKTQVFGPIPGTFFLIPVQVKLSKMDAGLPPAFPDNATVWVFRWNSATSKWDQHQLGKMKGSSFEYTIRTGHTCLG